MTMPIRTTAVLLSVAATVCAQNDYALDKTAGGTLGGNLTMAVSGAPANALLLVMPSFTAGPTPLAAVDPGDSRSLQVGTDLAANWFSLLTSGTGTATIDLPLPNNPTFAGIAMHWQTLTAPGATRIVDRISNDVVTQTGTANTSAFTAAALQFARGFATPIQAGGGNVLVAGGGAGSLTNATGLQSTELWDFRHLSVRPGPNMTVARALHLAVPLTSGRVLVIGGADALGTVLASCELYDPATNTFAATGAMATPRVMHAACRLPDGRVLVAGGTTSLADTTAAITNVQRSCEIYNPATGTWSGAAAIGGNRLAPALTTTTNGRVMVSGGVEVTLFFGVPLAAASTTTVQFYNPTTNAWSGGPAMAAARAGHHYNQVTLPDGRVLMTGGVNVPNLLGAANAAPIAGAEYYNPVANTWTTVNMPNARSLHTATVLQNGNVVVCGGGQGTLTAPVSIDNVDLFDLGTNSWTSLPALASPRGTHVAWRQPDGVVVLMGGQGAVSTLASVELMHF